MKWRYINNTYSLAYKNMAVDEAALSCTATHSPVFRFYKWENKAYTIGYFQKAQELKERGLINGHAPFVRRITGGGVVEHGEDLTYSVSCCKPEKYFGSNAKDIYKTLNTIFVAVLKIMSVEASLNSAKGPFLGRSMNCFQETSPYDILSRNIKIGGSAQRKMGDKFLQQGSLKLTGIDTNRFIKLFFERFAKHIGAEIEPSNLSSEEQKLAQHLCDTKYSKDIWNNKI